MQISVQIGLNWNWPTGTELGKNVINMKNTKKSKDAKKNAKKNASLAVLTVYQLMVS